MPSAFSLPCQTRSHFAPASITSGIAVMVTSCGGEGVGKFLCAASGLKERTDTRKSCLGRDIKTILSCVTASPGVREGAGGRHRAVGAFRMGGPAPLLPMTFQQQISADAGLETRRKLGGDNFLRGFVVPAVVLELASESDAYQDMRAVRRDSGHRRDAAEEQDAGRRPD